MRSYRELWLWLGAALLTLAAAFVAIALAYFTKEQSFSLYTSWQLLASIVVFMLAFGCFCLAILGKAFPPWAKRKFPDISFEIYGGGLIATSRPVPNGMQIPATIYSFRVRITNMDNEQNVSLTVNPYLKLVPGSAGRIGEAIGTVADWPLDPSFSLNRIQMPIVLAPGTTAGGDLVYEFLIFASGKLAEPMQTRFELVDHISNQRMSAMMGASMGTFNRDDMSPSHRGAEILGPEYDAAPASSEDDGKPEVAEEGGPSS